MKTERRICVDCADDFDLSLGERMFFDAKELSYPKRCKPCRVARKAERLETVGANPHPSA